MFGRREDRSGTPAPPADAGSEGSSPRKATAPARPRLVDLAGDWLVLVPALRACADLPDPVRLRERAQEARATFEREAKQWNFSDADIQSAVFSMTALLDETIRRGRGRARDEWLGRPLALDWFQTSNAGVEFFQRLDELRKERSSRIEALEVAACCLALGFEGRMATAREARTDLMNNLLLDVTAVRGQGEPAIAPHLISKDRIPSRAVAWIPRWIMVVAFVVGLLILWLGISQLSHYEAWHAVREIKPLNP